MSCTHSGSANCDYWLLSPPHTMVPRLHSSIRSQTVREDAIFCPHPGRHTCPSLSNPIPVLYLPILECTRVHPTPSPSAPSQKQCMCSFRPTSILSCPFLSISFHLCPYKIMPRHLLDVLFFSWWSPFILPYPHFESNNIRRNLKIIEHVQNIDEINRPLGWSLMCTLSVFMMSTMMSNLSHGLITIKCHFLWSWLKLCYLFNNSMSFPAG